MTGERILWSIGLTVLLDSILDEAQVNSWVKWLIALAPILFWNLLKTIITALESAVSAIDLSTMLNLGAV